MSKNKITLAILTGMLAVTAVPVQASNGVAFAVANKSNVGMLTQVGTPQGSLSPLKGFANDLPLVTVMKQITPNGWKVKKVKSGDLVLNNDMLVSWDGGKSWVETLNTIVKTYPVSATVYWAEKEIVLSPVAIEEVKPQAIFQLAGLPDTTTMTEGGSQFNETTEVVASSNGITTISEGNESASKTTTTTTESGVSITETKTVIKVEETQVVVEAPKKTWDLDSRKSLQENVTIWGNSAGYKVVWLGEDYPIDDFRILSGDFDSITGPIKQLADDYGPKSAVKVPLSFEFLQNATLVVKNFKFEQAGFPQWNN